LRGPRLFKRNPAKAGLRRAVSAAGQPAELVDDPQVDQAGREAARLGRVMAVPAFVAVAALVLYPLVRGFKSSLESSGVLYGEKTRFVGLLNYTQVIHDATAVASVLRTFEYVAIAIALEVTLGMIVAVVLRRIFPGRGVVLAILILPWALPSVVSGVLWRRVFDPDNGLLNSALLHLHLIHQPQVWLASSGWAIFFITIVHVWGVLPLVSLIFLAGLQSIPDEVYSASAVDGATALRQFRYITLPLLRPSLAITLTVGTLWSISIFDEIYVLNGTALNTRSILMQVYNTAFVNADFAHGTALAFLLAGISALFGVVYVLSLRSRTA
jgi:multiple sugar transport system permease protein